MEFPYNTFNSTKAPAYPLEIVNKNSLSSSICESYKTFSIYVWRLETIRTRTPTIDFRWERETDILSINYVHLQDTTIGWNRERLSAWKLQQQELHLR